MKPSDIKSIASVIGKLIRAQLGVMKQTVDQLVGRVEAVEKRDIESEIKRRCDEIVAAQMTQLRAELKAPSVQEIAAEVLRSIEVPRAPTMEEIVEIVAKVTLPTIPSAEDVAAVMMRNTPTMDQIIEQARAHIPTAEEIAKHVTVPMPVIPTVKEIAGEVPVGPSLEEIVEAVKEHLPSAADVAKFVPIPELPPMPELPPLPHVPSLDEILEAMKTLIPEPIKGDPGESVSAEDLRSMLTKMVDELPKAPTLEQIVESVTPLIPAPVKGDKGDACSVDDVREMVKGIIQTQIETLPKPKDGNSVTVDDVLPSIENHFAKWALEFERRAADQLSSAIQRIEKPKDGKDGLGFDDLHSFKAEQIGERIIKFSVASGDERIDLCEFKLSHPLHQGVFSDGREYDKGDTVTRDGCSWIALKDAPQGMPGSSDDWQLAVKKGRDGKDGVLKTPPPSVVRVPPRKQE